MRNKIVLEHKITTNDCIEAFKDEEYLFILDSSKENDNQSKYTYIGFNPVDYLIIDEDDKEKIVTKMNLFYKKNRKITDDMREVEGFNTGFLSFLTYDLGLIFMDIEEKRERNSKVPLGFIGYYPVIIRVENESSAYPIIYFDEGYYDIVKEILDRLNRSVEVKKQENGSNTKFILNYEEGFSDYEKKIKRVKDYIYEGDVYQINYTRQFVGEMENLDIYDLYMKLREKNPAPFSAFIVGCGWSILSTSPERLILNVDDRLETRPIKGTINVDKDKVKDEENKGKLLASIKDKSELLMIVDLERNDLSKVSVPGSVKVEELYKLETYETVHHLVSTISCIKDKDYSPLDVLYNIFPGGSITGTPKKRAMEIIEELEVYDRGIYTGSIGYIDNNGNFDFNIAIRTIVVEDSVIKFNVGGGITWKSDVRDEFFETVAKGLGMMRGLGFEDCN